MEINVTRWEANEILKSVDIIYSQDREYDNLCTIIEEILGHTTNDFIVDGLAVQQRATPSMNVDITIGLGYCKSTGKIAHTGGLFGPVAITNGGASDRIDTLEVRILETDYDQQQRAYKNPITGEITYQDIYTKKRYELEAQVILGSEGAGIAPNHTTGWIKIAEIYVSAGETTAIYDTDIENCAGGYDGEATSTWTAETITTFRLKTLEGTKSLFRTKHKEDGDHEDDIIKEQHIDWGTGASQVSAIDVPIADAGGRISAVEVENAIQELAGAGRTSENIKDNFDALVPIGSIMAWLPGYFNSDQSIFTSVSITLADNYKECDGTELNDSGSPIYNGAGRYLPNLTDDRFLMGVSALSGDLRGGSNAMAHTHSTPNHTHPFTQPTAHGITQPTFTYPNHRHETGYRDDAVSKWYGYDSGGSAIVKASGLAGFDAGSAMLRVSISSITFYTKLDGGGSCTRTTSVALTNNHSGGSVNSGGSGTSGGASNTENRPKYLSCKYIQRVK